MGQKQCDSVADGTVRMGETLFCFFHALFSGRFLLGFLRKQQSAYLILYIIYTVARTVRQRNGVTMKERKSNLHKLALTGIFSSIGFLLMLIEFPLPFIIPDFIKMDFSELPALICTFAAGPVWGVAVCLVKNLLHLTVTSTFGVGELANFILGASFVLPAGLVYKKAHSKKGALIAVIIGSLIGAVVSLPVNYYITYPFYMNFMSEEAILSAYRIFMPSVKNLFQTLTVFNVPFNALKFALDSTVTVLIYKRISSLFKK